MRLSPLNITSKEAETYFEEILARRNQRIGQEILANADLWTAWAIVPSGTSVQRAIRFQEGGIIDVSKDSYVWLRDYCRSRTEIKSLLWEDPWLKESDIKSKKLSEYNAFYFMGCAYYFCPFDNNISVDKLVFADLQMLAYPGCLYLSDEVERETVFHAHGFSKSVTAICISSYDEEGFVLYEKQ